MIDTKVAEAVTIHTRGLLFDMDGVLISSIGSVERSWKRWYAMHDVRNASSFVLPHGTRAVDIVRMLKPHWNEGQVADGLRAIEDLEIEDTGGLTVLPGAKALLQHLPPARWAIVTSATRRLLVARLAAAGLPVPERLISGDMVKRGKPDPEPYRRGAEMLGLRPEDCVVVEDAPSGIGAGIAAGSRILAVLGTHKRSDLAKADWIIQSLEHLVVTPTADGLELRLPAIES